MIEQGRLQSNLTQTLTYCFSFSIIGSKSDSAKCNSLILEMKIESVLYCVEGNRYLVLVEASKKEKSGIDSGE